MESPLLTYPDASVRHLRAPHVHGVLEAAVASRGLVLEAWEQRDKHARPGAETSVGFDVVASGKQMYLVASTVELTDEQRHRAGAVTLESEDARVSVWEYPRDPHLPGLPFAVNPAALEGKLTSALGVNVMLEGIDMLVYRPLRRAVVRARVRIGGVRTHMYVKAVRPDKAPDVIARHTIFEGALVPETFDLGDGILAMRQAHGRSLSRHLLGKSSSAMMIDAIDPAALIETLVRLPQEAVQFSVRKTPTAKLTSYLNAAATSDLPAERLAELGATIAEVLEGRDPGPVVATHGDYNVANIYVTNEDAVPQVSHLIDVDTLGPGYLIDDLACLVAHLAVLEPLAPSKYAGVPAYVDRVLEVSAEWVDPAALRARASAVVLSLASGCGVPERALAWLKEAERLAEQARRV